MIKVKVYFGTFVIRDGAYTGPAELKELFNIVTESPLEVWEGPEDYAIAMRMVDGTEFEILESEFPDEGLIH